MANPHPTHKFAPGNKLGTGGLTKEQREQRDRANAVLINPTNTATWAKAYMEAVIDKVPPVVLDYGNRLLGKPPESINVTDDRSNELLEMLKAVPPEDVLKFLDATKDEK